MSQNPYAPKVTRVMRSAPDVPATEGMRSGIRVNGNLRLGSGSAFSSNGELNASSMQDFMRQVGAMMQQAREGTMHVASNADRQREQAEKLAMLKEAYADKSDTAMQVMGEVMADQIWETLGREGFSRRIFAVSDIGDGQVARIKIRKKDVVAYQVTEDANVVASVVRQEWVYPPEYYLIASIEIGDKDIAQATPQLLDDKFQDGLEAIWRREDVISRRLMVNGSSAYNTPVFFSSFTPAALSSLRTQVNRWGLAASTAIIAWDLWDDISTQADFVRWFDPVMRHELILEGRLGTLMNMELITDGLRYQTLQVLNPGEIFVAGGPSTVGEICQRQELDSQAINKYNQNRPVRGWFMRQIQAQALVNGRAISRGSRV